MNNFRRNILVSIFNSLIIICTSAQSDENLIIEPEVKSINTSLPVGTTPGGYGVSESGSANYSIPIFTPPGTKGMAPSLSISYNSAAGDGLLGRGWNLSGISCITRTGTNLYHETSIDGVDFQSDDKFVLDGNRLISVTGTYGANGTTYYTELETFSKVISYGTAGTGPAYFIVETKDGLTLKYGFTADSRIEASGRSEVMIWYLNEVKDKYDNYIRYTYYENSGTGEFRPLKIEYTGNDRLSKAPFNSIEFTYISRADSYHNYISGSTQFNNVVLQKIQVKNSTNLVREYNMAYTTLNNHVCLTSITEKGSDGNQLNPTTISWGSRYTTADEFAGPIIAGYNFGDFNGDGRMDIIGNNFNGQLCVYLTDKNKNNISYTISTVIDPFLEYGGKIISSDLDGDGNEDLIILDWEWDNLYPGPGDYKKFYIMRSINGVFNPQDKISFTISARDDHTVGDFDCDGRSEILTIENGIIKMYKFVATGQGFTYTVSNLTFKNFAGDLYSEKGQVPFDFNGDGDQELLAVDSIGAAVYDPYVQYPTIPLFESDFPRINDEFIFGDFNGDGNTDIFGNDSINWYVCYNTGTGYTKTIVNISGILPNIYNYFYPAELDGDGLTDIMFVGYGTQYNGGGNLPKAYAMYSKGDAFIAPVVLKSFSDNFGISNCGVVDLTGDGLSELFGKYSGNTSLAFRFFDGQKHNFVQYITNGLDARIQYDYVPLTDYDVYTKGSGATYPMVDYISSDYVVSALKVPDGIGGIMQTNYTYQEAKVHLKGKGFLGFSKFISANITAGFRVENTFNFNNTYFFPYLSNSLTKNSAGNPISNVNYTSSLNSYGSNRIFPYISQIQALDVLTNITTTTDYTYNLAGNLTFSSTNNNGEGSATITNTFTTAGGWMENKLDYSTVTKTTSLGTNTRKIDYTYNSYGDLTSAITDPDKTNKITTTYGYNSTFGNLIKVTQSATGMTSRYVDYIYDANGRYIEKVTNMIGQYSTSTHDAKTGNVLTSTDITGKVTTNTYDGFGRLLTTLLPTGQTITNTLVWKDANGPSTAVYYSAATNCGAPDSRAYFDLLGRQVRSMTEGFDGTNIFSDVEYNNKGQLYRGSEPYFTGGTPEWTTYSYDSYGRNTTVNSPFNSISIAYSGKTVTTTNLSVTPNQVSSKTINGLGQLVSATDAGGTLAYVYYPSGQLKNVTAPGSIVTNLVYDEYGNQTSVTDPSAGIYNYGYNAFGELISQSHNGTNPVSITYDNLGRITTLGETEGTTTYAYVTTNNGKGLISTITSSTGPKITYTYDAYSRPLQIAQLIDGVTYSESVEYDACGRLQKLTYPSTFAVTYHYNNQSYLSQVKRADTQALIWQANSANANGQLIQFKSGNNLVTDQTYNHGMITGIKTGTVQDLNYTWNLATGNLTTRKDVKRNLTENFTYDNLNRLTQIAITGGASFSYTYNSNGNITSGTNAGTYSYLSSKPYAVSSVTNPSGVIPTTTQTIDYTSFDKVKKITEGTKVLDITYGVDKNRWKTVFNNNGSILTKYSLFGGNYEKESGTKTRELHYISAASGVVAVYIKQSSGNKLYYVHKDHLGSYSTITDETGVVVSDRSFDAWGRERNVSNWTYTGLPSNPLLDKGFTGHEHLTAFNLINMNGRVYDPLTGRFLSSDPYVQNPSFTQSFNRYSYCVNNPLKYTDPSGYRAYAQMDWSPDPFHHSLGFMSGGGEPRHSLYGHDRIDERNKYHYDYTSGTYRDSQGNIVDPQEVEDYETSMGFAFVAFQYQPGVTILYGSAVTGGYVIGGENSAADDGWTTLVSPNSIQWTCGSPGISPFALYDIMANVSNVGSAAGGGGGDIDPRISGGLVVGGGTIDGLGQGYKYCNNNVKYAQRINGKIRNPSVLTRANQMNATKMASGLKVVGRGVTVLSIAASGYQFANSDMSGNDYARLAGAGVIAATAFIPLVGPLISIGLGVADSYGAFDGIYNYFE